MVPPAAAIQRSSSQENGAAKNLSGQTSQATCSRVVSCSVQCTRFSGVLVFFTLAVGDGPDSSAGPSRSQLNELIQAHQHCNQGSILSIFLSLESMVGGRVEHVLPQLWGTEVTSHVTVTRRELHHLLRLDETRSGIGRVSRDSEFWIASGWLKKGTPVAAQFQALPADRAAPNEERSLDPTAGALPYRIHRPPSWCVLIWASNRSDFRSSCVYGVRRRTDGLETSEDMAHGGAIGARCEVQRGVSTRHSLQNVADVEKVCGGGVFH